jgi:bacterial/archaeal transporter family protein
MPFSSWLFWAILGAVFAALTSILAKVAVKTIEPDYAAFLRTAIILVSLAVYVIAFGKWQNPFHMSGSSAAFLVFSGIATGASWLCYFRALTLSQASKVDPIDKSSVLLVAILGVLLLGERLSLTQWGGVVLVGIGAALVAFKVEASQ